MNKKYQKIIEHYESCLKNHGDSHLGVDWPDKENAIKRYQIMLEVIREKEHQNVSLLDFGCGTAHLYEYILEKKLDFIDYSGLEISSSFIEMAKKKFQSVDFYLMDILDSVSELPDFDYIVCNGVFTEKRELSFEEMWEYFREILPLIYSKVEKGLAFNVMSKDVDWERWDLFHLPMHLLSEFLTKEISRHFIIRNDYGLYEYTVYLYKSPV